MSTTSLITFAEFEHWPDNPGKRELIDGEVIELPPPKLLHARIARRIYELLRTGPLCDRVWHEIGYRVGGGWLQPDVSVSHPHQRVDNDYLVGSPLLAVEVLSPANTAAQIDRKLTLYFQENACEVWVLNPAKRSMTVYRRDTAGGPVARIPVEHSYSSPSAEVAVELSRIFGS